MSPLIGIFVITLLSSILYNKFDANSRATTTRKNPYYSFEKLNEKSARRENLKDETQNSENWDKKEEETGFAFENISELDVCIFTVVAGNQKFCKEKTHENLEHLTLLMMSCHTASEDNRFPKCTTEKTFAECISSSNTADLEMFKHVKKRALTVCQEVSQQLFMINSQRRAQALLETAQLHSSVMTSFKDNQKLLENITSQTLTRLRAQRVAFMKDMRLFKKYFTKNESLFMEAARAHLTLLSRHKEIIGGLEKDVNVLTEGFLQSLEVMQDNFTAFSVKIFEKHREIMVNLNRVENTADKILRQLEMIEEYDYTMLKNFFNWIMVNIWRSREIICVVLSAFLIIYGLILRTKIFTWIKFVLMASAIGGIFLQYEYVGLLIAAWFMSILGEIFVWCFISLTNGRVETEATGINPSVGHSSGFGIQEDKTGEPSDESSTLNDSLGHDSGNRDNIRSSMRSTVAVLESTTGDSNGENYNIKGDNTGPHTTSISGLTKSRISQNVNTTNDSSNATENETRDDQSLATRGDNMVLQDTMGGCETVSSPVTEHSGAIMGTEVQTSRENTVQDRTSLDIQEQNRLSSRQNEKQSSTSSGTRGYCSTNGDFVVQRGMRTRNMEPKSNEGIDWKEHQGLTTGKRVQTSTVCDSGVQTMPGNDMAAQTSNQRDSEVQTGPSEDISVQTDTTEERFVQTNTDKVIGVQTSTTDDSEVQTDTTIDMAVQRSARNDREVQTGTSNDINNQMNTRSDGQVQTDTREHAMLEGDGNTSSNVGFQTSTRGDSELQTGASGVTGVWRSTDDDNQVQQDTNNETTLEASTRRDRHIHIRTSSVTEARSTRDDSEGQTEATNDTIGHTSGRDDMALEARTSDVTGVQTRSRYDSNLHDFGVPHEPLGIPDEETTATIPRQSGIIVNIGDNFSNSRIQRSSPGRQSRASSPFEVVTGNFRRPSSTYVDTGGSTAMDMRGVSQDIAGEAGTSGEFSTIQVGVQINRAGSPGDRRECGLMTLQGTPCKRRVSAGRCYIHRDSRQ